MLTAERVALNFLGHLSGVASATATLVEAVNGHKARICCTRKTMPGLRAVQKYAVRVGGGINHRFGLDDAVLIKDNHVAAAGGVREAIEAARAGVGHLVKIEVEVDSLDQLEEAMATGVDAVLLDNMGPNLLAEAVRMIDGRAVTEASGRITPRHRAGNRGRGRRSHFRRLADAQRVGARHRARLAALGGRSYPSFKRTMEGTLGKPRHRRRRPYLRAAGGVERLYREAPSRERDPEERDGSRLSGRARRSSSSRRRCA